MFDFETVPHIGQVGLICFTAKAGTGLLTLLLLCSTCYNYMVLSQCLSRYVGILTCYLCLRLVVCMVSAVPAKGGDW